MLQFIFLFSQVCSPHLSQCFVYSCCCYVLTMYFWCKAVQGFVLY